MDNEHGEYKISVDGNIIFACLKGSFNCKGASAFTNNMKATIKTYDGRPFSILVNNLNLSGGTPEAYEMLDEYNEWLNSQNMSAKAMVMTSKITAGILHERAPSRRTQKIKTFDNEDDAITWLKQQK